MKNGFGTGGSAQSSKSPGGVAKMDHVDRAEWCDRVPLRRDHAIPFHVKIMLGASGWLESNCSV